MTRALSVSVGLEPDVRNLDVAREERPRRDVVAHLLPVKGDGQVRIDGRTSNLARGRVHSGWEVDAQNRRAEVVHLLDQLRSARPRLALEAGPEEAVDDHVRIAEVLVLVLRLRVDDEHVPPRLFEHAGGDPSVAPVRAAPADDRERLRVAEVLERVPGDRLPRALHQLLDRSVVPLLGRAHLGRGVERLRHPGRRPGRPPLRAPSNATWRGRSHRRAPCPPRPSSGPRASRRASAARRSRSRAT